MQNNIEISLNKNKFGWMLLGCLLMLIVSVWLFNIAGKQNDYSSSFLKGLGMIGFIFSIIGGVFLSKKRSDKSAGLTINDKGIVENTNGFSARLVEWKDIIGFEKLEIGRQKLILVKVKKPQKYIDKASNNAQKRLLRLNEKEYGTPISIAANSLQMDFEELLALLQNKKPKRKN